MSDGMSMVKWRQQCDRCGAWFVGECLSRSVLYEQTYQGITVRHHGWVKERVICPDCQAPRRKRAEMDI